MKKSSNSRFKTTLTWLLVALAVVVVAFLFYDALNPAEELTWSQVTDLFENDKITYFELDVEGNLNFKALVADAEGNV